MISYYYNTKLEHLQYKNITQSQNKGARIFLPKDFIYFARFVYL